MMKDSGIEWVGSIPYNWAVVPAGGLFTEIKEKNKNLKYRNPLQFKFGTIVDKAYVGDLDANLLETLSTYTCVEPDTIILNGLNLNYDFVSQRVAIVTKPGVITSAYLAVYPDKSRILPRYANYLLKAYDSIFVFHGMGSGVRKTLQWKDFKNLKFVLPSKEEQSSIIETLDSLVAKTDALIANDQTQIEKLKAYKQSLITEVVTKGLDPAVPMKDSELLWFGTIPKHWKLAKIKLFASTCSGGTPPSGDMSYYDGDVNWVCSYDLHEAEITETGKTLSDKGAALIAGEMQSPNSILIAMYGGSGTIGNSGLLKCHARTNQAICSVNFDEAVLDPRFAFYQTMFIRKYWMYYAVGTRKDPNISQDVVRNMKYVIPPMEEQQEIVRLMDGKCSQIDRLLAIKQSKIEKLEQYKRSLIYEYVTGKKEVPAQY